MTSFTPGPWFANQCGIYSENPANEKPGTPMGHALIACTGDEGDEHAGLEQLANAKLIAAAPEMAEALKTALWMLERDFIDDQKMNVIEIIRDALAKAGVE